MARIAVCGSEGFIGQHLVKHLKKLGHKVYPIDLNYKPDPVDLTSYTDTKRHLEELTDHKTKPIDVVFNLATMPLPLSLINPYKVVHSIYCMGTVLCELAREGYFKTLIHCSSSEVYDITTPYAAAKDAQDKLIKAYVRSFGIDAKTARPFNTYGEGQDLGALIPNTIKRILKHQRPIINGDGKQKRDYIYVGDTIKGIINVWKKGVKWGIYNITSGQCYTVNEVVKKISKIMNYKGKPIYLQNRKGDTPIIHGRKSYNKYTSFDEGLQRTIEWWRNQNFTL